MALVLEDQRLSPAALRGCAARFGPLFVHYNEVGVLPVEGVPEVLEARKEPHGSRLFGGSDWHAGINFRKPGQQVNWDNRFTRHYPIDDFTRHQRLPFRCSTLDAD